MSESIHDVAADFRAQMLLLLANCRRWRLLNALVTHVERVVRVGVTPKGSVRLVECKK